MALLLKWLLQYNGSSSYYFYLFSIKNINKEAGKCIYNKRTSLELLTITEICPGPYSDM